MLTLQAHVPLMRNGGRDEKYEAGEVEEGLCPIFLPGFLKTVSISHRKVNWSVYLTE